MSTDAANLLRGTLELLVLKSLTGGARHGYAVSEWLEDVSDGALALEEGTLYPALHRMERRGLVEASWGLSENNRRAKFYALTDEGRQRLAEQTRTWESHAAAVARALATTVPAAT